MRVKCRLFLVSEAAVLFPFQHFSHKIESDGIVIQPKSLPRKLPGISEWSLILYVGDLVRLRRCRKPKKKAAMSKNDSSE